VLAQLRHLQRPVVAGEEDEVDLRLELLRADGAGDLVARERGAAAGDREVVRDGVAAQGVREVDDRGTVRDLSGEVVVGAGSARNPSYGGRMPGGLHFLAVFTGG